MNSDQAIDILKTINELYPRFEITDRKVKMLLPKLLEMDFDRVMARLSEHVAEKPYPPTLAEIAAYAPKENKHLEKIERWKEEAEKVPNEIRQDFFAKVQALVEAKCK